MGRRSDHTPDELHDLLVSRGHEVMAERGFAKFSAREAARRAGYSVGTIYNVFGGLDGYLIAINSHTFRKWSACLQSALADETGDGDARIAALVRAYFAFADSNRNAWMAIYDHRIDRTNAVAKADETAREELTGIVDAEVTRWLGQPEDASTRRLVRSLIATVHGHCALWLTGSYALLQEEDPAGQALARVMEALAAQRS
ncbi:TetR/AcrR family transcriptional regulator [Aurantiacibacter rhizosphaerae]|uniref:TetR family transcriptional regulator n=1 Tax=Aurantiacibacter rhizosphaerae TaxID=2691582 RepID=A0A844XGQ5_9SPHN|nr:TetR/AcrR family transcriptional regulator [Aurantiacibacter rhizosphaerae]MWV28919.1 TetR family transcriptional regulator [Aurantiacibacter rhizosphaerae]